MASCSLVNPTSEQRDAALPGSDSRFKRAAAQLDCAHPELLYELMAGIEIGVGVALAAPGLIDVVFRGAIALYEKIETFRKIDETMNR